MKRIKAITGKTSLHQIRAPETIGTLLERKLCDHGSGVILARKAGITLSYLSRMRHDRVFHVSEPIKRTLSEAMGISVGTLSDALDATEKKISGSTAKQGRK